MRRPSGAIARSRYRSCALKYVSGGAALKTAWVVGDNPRLLYLPHVKPLTRYVVHIAPQLPSAGGATLSAPGGYSVRPAAFSPIG